MGKHFGTGGSRDEASVDLTVEHAYKVGRPLGWCYRQKIPDERCRAVIGKDTRCSNHMFGYSLAVGLTALSVDVHLLHVTTTPSVSYVVCTEGFNYEITISANHNSFYDSGIKVINRRGEKLEEFVILGVEKYLDGEAAETPLTKRKHVGRIVDFAAGRGHYIGYLIPVAIRSFKDMKVALDCSNGSTFTITKNIFDTSGVGTHVMSNESNGLNINTNRDSIHTEYLQKLVVDEKYDVGFTYDGDADQRIVVDKNGCVADGNNITYIYGKYMKEQGSLFNNTVVTTIMSNFGLYKAFDREGIVYVKVAVGDKYVYENMVVTDYYLSGEQSGHIIFSRHVITGGDAPTFLRVMEVVLEKKRPPSKLASEVEIYPRVLKNIWVRDKKAAQDSEIVQAEVARMTRSLGSNGRILLRQSGIEPVIHVMVEASDIQIYETYMDQVIQIMKDWGHCI